MELKYTGLAFAALLAGCSGYSPGNGYETRDLGDGAKAFISRDMKTVEILHDDGDFVISTIGCSFHPKGYMIVDDVCNGNVERVNFPDLNAPFKYGMNLELKRGVTVRTIIEGGTLERAEFSPEQREHLDGIVLFYERKFGARELLEGLQ